MRVQGENAADVRSSGLKARSLFGSRIGGARKREIPSRNEAVFG